MGTPGAAAGKGRWRLVAAGLVAALIAGGVLAGRRVGTATLTFTSDPSGAEVYLDDVMVGVTPLEVPGVLPRERHQVVLRMSGRREWSERVGDLSAWSTRAYFIDLPPPPPPAAPPPPPVEPTPPPAPVPERTVEAEPARARALFTPRFGTPPVDMDLTEKDHGLEPAGEYVFKVRLVPFVPYRVSAEGGWSAGEAQGEPGWNEGLFVAAARAGRRPAARRHSYDPPWDAVTAFLAGERDVAIPAGSMELYAFTVIDRRGMPLEGAPALVVRDGVSPDRFTRHPVPPSRHPLVMDAGAVFNLEGLDPATVYRVTLTGDPGAKVLSLWTELLPGGRARFTPRLDGVSSFTVTRATRAKLAVLRGTSATDEPVRLVVLEDGG